MSAPVRLRLSRQKGFDLQAHSQEVNGLPALKVTLGGRFGNHYVVRKSDLGPDWFVHANSCRWGPFATEEGAVREAVARYRADVTQSGPHNHRLIDPVPTRVDIMKALRGRNLACFCAIGAPCHADVLLEVANGSLREAAQ